MLKRLLELVKGKNVFLGTHWDADGITSGAMVYHLIKDHAKSVKTLSKGHVFRIEKKDVPEDAEIVICTDIHPDAGIEQPVIYIDHHPVQENEMDSDTNLKEDFLLKVYDKDAQSCSLVVWENFLQDTDDPYFIFLTLLGFFGDNGDNEKIPEELEMKAMELFPELMIKRDSFYSDKPYLEIEKFVSRLNTGKRMHWSGEVPLALFTSIDTIEPFVHGLHPLAQELDEYRRILRGFYNMPVQIHSLPHIDYIQIDCDKNVQGVLCARHMKSKPIIAFNKFNGSVMGSMRVPEELDFDAGAYLESFFGEIPGYVGGGHEKAGGVSFPAKHFNTFIELIKKNRSDHI
ncbi:MAG: DHH family phosphoesterase [Nanoarchaeota archaeon]|nr:DHH family phosphoesterase [Nanoarchaeota archaeon]